ncbi:MAG: (Fe-S)-binding protein [Candidatus Helarchaeota archaeon]
MSGKSVDEILKSLGQKDCGQCGYESCKDLAKAIFEDKESIYKCVHVDKVQVKVDGKEIKVKEFVQSFISGTIIGFATRLKGIPENFKEIEIKIQRS